MPRDNFMMSESSDSFGMQQRQDRFDAIGDLIVGPPGPPGPQGPPGADGTVSFDELTPAQRESLRGEDGADGVSPAVSFTTITGGHTMTVTDKDHPSGQSINIMDGTSGGSGTSDYTDLTNKPSINNVTLSGNKTTAELGLTSPVQSVNNKTGAVVLSASDVSALPLAGGTMEGDIDMGSNKITNLPMPTNYLDAANKNYVDKRYIKPSSGIPKSDLASAVQTSLGLADSALQSVPSTYRTAAAQDAIDAAQDAEIGIVITGKRPSMAVTAGQFVIVRNSTISGISDGLYTANAALSPSTDVTAASLSAVNIGGLNFLLSKIEDSGWKNLTLTSAFTEYNSNNAPKYRKIGNIVTLRGAVKPTAEITGSSGYTIIANLPTGFRPSGDNVYVCQGSGMNRWTLAVSSNGDIGVARYGTTAIANIPANAWLPFAVTFFAG